MHQRPFRKLEGSGPRKARAKSGESESNTLDDAMPPNTGIGGRIKEIRTLTGLKQRDLASLSRVDPSYLSRVERNQSKPSLEILGALLRLSPSVNLRYVFFGVGEPFLEGRPIQVRDVAELEALLIRASEEEAKLPAKFDPAHISAETYRRWLARNLYEQAERMAAHMGHPNISSVWQPDAKAKAIAEVEAALDAAEASDKPPPAEPRLRRLKRP